MGSIGHHYATEPTLVLKPATGRYSAEATPEAGADLLFDYYRRLLAGEEAVALGEHAVF